MGGDLYEIITFENAIVSRKDVWDRVNGCEYVRKLHATGHDNKNMSLQVISLLLGKIVKFDGNTATEDMVKIEYAEVVLGSTKYEENVSTVLDAESNMLLDHFTHVTKTATVKEIWDAAERQWSLFDRSIWKIVNEIHVGALAIMKQTPKDTVVQVENAKFLINVKAQGVTHMAPFWRAEHPYKTHKYTGLFRFKGTQMTIQNIWDAVEQEVVSANTRTYIVTLEELRIEMAKGTKSIEVNLKGKKDNTNKLDVTTITDVICGVRTVTRDIGRGQAFENLRNIVTYRRSDGTTLFDKMESLKDIKPDYERLGKN